LLIADWSAQLHGSGTGHADNPQSTICNPPPTNMRYTAKHRFADVGPRKIRLFANLVRGKNVDDALQLLRFYPNRGAKLLMAVLQSAYGNADDQEHPDPDSLIVAECRVDGAPTFKRIQPRARGTAFQIKRRMSHIVVALADPADLFPQETETETPETGAGVGAEPAAGAPTQPHAPPGDTSTTPPGGAPAPEQASGTPPT
jgi:large subunit ribosomal protein L22